MDNRLVLVVLFVTLSWVSMGTYAQITVASNVTNSNMTTASDSNMTTAAGSNVTSAPNVTMATNMTTAAGSNVTSAPNVTMATNMTTAAGSNVTSAPNVTMATNMTTAAGSNVTSAPNATMATNMTTAAGSNATSAPNATMATNMTTAAGNNATSAPNATLATNVTTAAGNNTNNTTASPTIAATTATPTTITTVGTLPSPVSNSDCRTSKLCAAEPSSCNPSVAGNCFFLSAKQNNQLSQSFDFELSGESGGYLAATLSADNSLGGDDPTYVCANNNNTVKFIAAFLNNNQLTQTNLPASNVRGNITGTRIQCTFTVTVPNTRAANSAVGISTGPFNSTSGTLGAPVFKLRSSVIDLQNVNTTVINEITNHAITFQLSLMQALLISVGVLGLSMQ